MTTKAEIKKYKSLSSKKHRDEHGLFIVEGVKVVEEFLQSNLKLSILLTDDDDIFSSYTKLGINTDRISSKDISQISNLKTPNKLIAIFEKPSESIDRDLIDSSYTLILDNINDPGNLGTIIRIADWFGIKQIICSPNTVDKFNPKVIQSTMGSLTRVIVAYTDLPVFIESLNNSVPVYGTFLEGENIYTSELQKNGLIVMGSESHGVSAEIEKFVGNKIHIPSFNTSGTHAESLNVGVATGIICSEFARR